MCKKKEVVLAYGKKLQGFVAEVGDPSSCDKTQSLLS